MRTEPDIMLNRLVVAALSVFIALVIVLAALALRQIWLQQRLVDASSELQVNLIELEETTEEIQLQLEEIRTTTETDADIEEWEDITDLLDDVDKQLDSLERDIGDVTTAVIEPSGEPFSGPEATGENMANSVSDDEGTEDVSQDSVDQLFTIVAALVGGASIAIAILLWMAARVRRHVPAGPHNYRNEFRNEFRSN